MDTFVYNEEKITRIERENGYGLTSQKMHTFVSCPLLIILKSAFFRGLRVYELKFRSKKDNEIIFFSSES